MLAELFAVNHGGGVDSGLCSFNALTGCPGSVFGFEVLQFADDGAAGNTFYQGQ